MQCCALQTLHSSACQVLWENLFKFTGVKVRVLSLEHVFSYSSAVLRRVVQDKLICFLLQ